MSKDQAIGAAIFLICLAIVIIYPATLLFPAWLGLVGLKVAEAEVRFWMIAIPVFITFMIITGIGAWIGWTMATTPLPKPMEETTDEIKDESK